MLSEQGFPRFIGANVLTQDNSRITTSSAVIVNESNKATAFPWGPFLIRSWDLDQVFVRRSNARIERLEVGLSWDDPMGHHEK